MVLDPPAKAAAAAAAASPCDRDSPDGGSDDVMSGFMKDGADDNAFCAASFEVCVCAPVACGEVCG